MVTRDNFGLLPAQVAGVSLLTDYVLTVAVSTAAGTAALISAFPTFSPYAVPLSLFFIGLIAFMNLKGVRESGKVFAVPTYFFIGIMGVMLLVGIIKLIGGNLGTIDPVHGMLKAKKQGSAADGLFYGAGLAAMLHAFAVSGTAVTGVEAISNGVTAFKKPGVAQRPPHPRDHGLRPRHPVPRPVVPRLPRAPGPVRLRGTRRSSRRSARRSSAPAPPAP